ncbi:multicopper oxidase domain-containing protein [Streptomyces sp. S1A(2023)]
MKKTRGRRRLKRVLITLAVVVGVFAAAVGGSFAWLWTSSDISTVGKVRFDNALAVPPLAPSTVDKDGTRVFDLRMRAGSTEFRKGVATPTWGFNGGHLGPTLRAERGEQVKVRVRNTLDEASSVHWHGMHLPAAMDGGPHQMVEAGGTWTPRWKVDPAGVDALVPPAPARRDGTARAEGARGDVPARRRALRTARPAEDVRGGRPAGDGAGRHLRRRGPRPRPRVPGQHRLPRGADHGQRHARPVRRGRRRARTVAPAQRVDRPHLHLRLRRRPLLRPGGDGRRAAGGARLDEPDTALAG